MELGQDQRESKHRGEDREGSAPRSKGAEEDGGQKESTECVPPDLESSELRHEKWLLGSKRAARWCLLYFETSNTKRVGVGWGESILTPAALDSETMEVGSREMSFKSLRRYNQPPPTQCHTKSSQHTGKGEGDSGETRSSVGESEAASIITRAVSALDALEGGTQGGGRSGLCGITSPHGPALSCANRINPFCLGEGFREERARGLGLGGCIPNVCLLARVMGGATLELI